jgi:hypothetical protein
MPGSCGGQRSARGARTRPDGRRVLLTALGSPLPNDEECSSLRNVCAPAAPIFCCCLCCLCSARVPLAVVWRSARRTVLFPRQDRITCVTLLPGAGGYSPRMAIGSSSAALRCR